MTYRGTARQRRRTAARRTGGLGSLSERRRRKLMAYVFTGLSILVALSMALPFCTTLGR
jgi:hypothetical protein